MTLAAHIEALLFWKAEPISFTELARLLGAAEEEVRAAAGELERVLERRGITLLRDDARIELRTAKDASGVIEALAEEELSKDLSKAALETLSIILYRGPVSRRDIEYIRGLNASFILRALLMRGLIERTFDARNERALLYKPSFELLALLGIRSAAELPQYDVVQREIEAFQSREKEASNANGGEDAAREK